MKARLCRRMFSFLLSIVLVCTVVNMPVDAATTVKVLEDQVSVTDTTGTGKAIDGGVEISVTAKAAIYNITGKSATNTITIKNMSGVKAEISFNFSANNHESCTFTSTGTSTGIRHTVVLDENAEITIALTVKASVGTSKTATLTLSDFAIKKFSNESVTISVTSNNSSLGVATVNNGSSVSITSGETVTLKATPNNSTFLGWVNTVDNSVVSTAASYTYTAAETVALEAKFINTEDPVWFAVGDTGATTTQDAYEALDKDAVLGGEYDDAYTYYTVTPLYLYDNLTDALNKANGSTHKGVVPMNNGTISGDYTIPAGVTLLIPFDSAHTMYTTVPGFIYSDNKGVENLYRSLTLAPGTDIVVNGAISVSTNAHSADGAETGGYPCGDYSKLVMQQGSTITMNSGSALYAWGFITGDSTGSGTITVKSGATVYESFQMAGHRGGNQSTKMKNKVFPISQYYVHNVEVPMTMEFGSVGLCNTYINVSSLLYKDTQVPITFVSSSGGLFNLTSGSVTKSYDGATDRWTLEINGNVTVSPIELSFGDDGSINSKSYVLGINNNLTLKINSGTVTVGQDIAFQPGSELVIEEGAKCILNEGISAYVYDGDTWGNFCFNGGDVQIIPVKFSPTRTYNRSAADLADVTIQVDGEIDASAGYLYTTAGGANIYSTDSGVVKLNTCADTTTYQYSQVADTYTNIAATSAKLTNGDGTLVSTIAGTYNYDSTAGAWRCAEHTDADDDSTCDICGYVLCTHEKTAVLDAVEPTCTATGLTAGEKCLDCDKILIAQEEVEMAAHTPGDAAACETAQVCTICGAELTAKLGHDASGQWLTNEGNTKHYKLCGVCGEATEMEDHSVGTAGTAATCMESAVCGVCGLSYGTPNSENHNFSAEWSTNTDGHWKVCLNGCTVKGSEGTHSGGTANCVDQAVCKDCQKAYGSTNTNTHKTVKTDAAKAPTCTEPGLTEGSHCEACSTVIVEQTEVSALDHNPGAAATCTTAQTCTRCTYVYQEKLGHSYTDYVSNKDAKCEVDGTETAKCDRCDETDTRTEEGSALKHSYTKYESNNNATCQVNGTETAKCDNGCGGTQTRPIENSKADHKFETYTSDGNATCLTDGTKTAKCIWCDNTDTVADEDSALGHEWGEYISDGNATCLADGTETATCIRCVATDTRTDEDSALDHSFTNYIPNPDAVCGKDGTKTAKCDRCDETDTVTYEGSALVHQFTTYTYNNDAKCGVDGTKTAKCDHGCGTENKITEEGTALTHSYTNYVSDGNASCTQDGTKTAYCVHGCGTKDTVADVDSALDHNFTNYVSNNNATCTANGTETGTCSLCGATDTQEIPNSILPHSYNNYVSNGDATCTKDGTKTAKCDNCTSTSTVTDEGSMLDHSYGDWKIVTYATCTAAGEKHRDCVNCDAYETAKIEATGHDMGNWVTTKDATCEIGGEKRRDCEKCDHYETEVINALTHNYTSVVTKQPTCVDKGVETFTCANCQNSYTQEIAATGVHTEKTREENRTEATCGADGSYNLVTYCSVCTQVLNTEAKIIPATGEHSYESAVTVEPTCIAVGERTYTCTVCQDSYTEEIEMADHTVSEIYTTENGTHFQACTTEGCTYKANEAECSGGEATCKDKAVCETCGEAYGELDAENHTGGTELRGAEAATCTNAGYTGDTYCLGCDVKIESGTPTGMLAHRWKDATYTAPKTCSVCGATEGEPLVKVENLGQANDEQINSTVDAIVNSTDTVQPEDSGIEAEGNQSVINSAKEEMQIQGSNVSYETTLEIKLNAVTVDESSIVTKITYDVTPMLYARDADGDVVGSTELNNFNEEITFHLPVDKNTTADFARVWHTHNDETIDMGLHKITLDGDHKYIEVKSAKFSAFTVEVVEECTEHTGGTATCEKLAVCELCGEKYGELGEHNPGEAVVENRVESTSVAAGKYDSVVYCAVCGTEISRDTITLPLAATPFAGVTMSLESNLAINFVINTNKLSGTGHYAILTREFADGREDEVIRIDQSDWVSRNGSATQKQITYNKLAAKEMCDEFHVELYNTSGVLVAVYNESVRNYATRCIENYSKPENFDAERLAMYVDLLNYGAASQTKFGYDLDNLANKNLTATQQGYATPTVTDAVNCQVKDTGYAGTVLSLESEIKLYFVFDKTEITQDMYAVLTYTAHTGRQYNVRIDGKDFEEYSTTRWKIAATGLALADGGQVVTCTIYNVNGEVVSTVQDSIESYASRDKGKTELYTMILKVTRSCYNYFH